MFNGAFREFLDKQTKAQRLEQERLANLRINHPIKYRFDRFKDKLGWCLLLLMFTSPFWIIGDLLGLLLA